MRRPAFVPEAAASGGEGLRGLQLALPRHPATRRACCSQESSGKGLFRGRVRIRALARGKTQRCRLAAGPGLLPRSPTRGRVARGFGGEEAGLRRTSNPTTPPPPTHIQQCWYGRPVQQVLPRTGSRGPGGGGTRGGAECRWCRRYDGRTRRRRGGCAAHGACPAGPGQYQLARRGHCTGRGSRRACCGASSRGARRCWRHARGVGQSFHPLHVLPQEGRPAGLHVQVRPAVLWPAPLRRGPCLHV